MLIRKPVIDELKHKFSTAKRTLSDYHYAVTTGKLSRSLKIQQHLSNGKLYHQVSLGPDRAFRRVKLPKFIWDRLR